MPTRPAFRLARALVFAVVCVALAIAGHVLVSREPVPPVAVAAGLVVLTALAVALAGTERSLPTILGGLLGGQFTLHALFAAAQHGQHLGHGHPAAAHAHGGSAMTLAHVAAAAVAAWWLRRGERATWTLAREIAAAAVRPILAILRAYRSAPPVACRPVQPIAPVALRGRALRHVVVRRGPPAPSIALV